MTRTRCASSSSARQSTAQPDRSPDGRSSRVLTALDLPCQHFVTPYRDRARCSDREELAQRVAEFERRGGSSSAAAAHAHRVRPGDAAGDGLLQRHRDYSRHLSGRAAGERPQCLIDFPARLPLRDRRSHVTVRRSGDVHGDARARRPWSSTGSGSPRARHRPLSFPEFESLSTRRSSCRPPGPVRAEGRRAANRTGDRPTGLPTRDRAAALRQVETARAGAPARRAGQRVLVHLTKRTPRT